MVRGGWNDADLEALGEQEEARRKAANTIRTMVKHLREQGCPWSVIAEELGITRQTAWKKYGPQ